jgi:predicted secreted protein
VTATVTATAPGTGTPTGSVSLSGSGLPAATLVAGKATFTYTGSSPGTASLQAVYAGDSRFNGSSSASVSQVVGKAATTATVTTSANPSTYFDGTTATVTVAPVAPGAGTPTGTVRLIPGNGTVTLSGGKATWLLRDTTPGSVTLSAVYNGDANFATSTSRSARQ